MRAAILCFTGNGLKLSRRVAQVLEETWDEVRIYGKSRFLDLLTLPHSTCWTMSMVSSSV